MRKKLDQMMRSLMSVVTISAFALVPFAHSAIPVAHAQEALPTGEITSPVEGETVSGDLNLVAVYTDGDEENDDEVDWAVRAGTCEAGTGAVFGNVDGHDDPFNWNGSLFTSTFDTTTVEDGDYCFVFNPVDDEEPETDVRETANFVVDNSGAEDEEGGSISGMKWNDEDGDGVKDEGEEGLAGWTIELIDGSTTTTVVTEEDGNYSFTGLLEGDYGVCEEGQPDWTQTHPSDDMENARLCDEGRTIGYDLTLGEEEDASGIDFGNMSDLEEPVATTTVTVTKVIVNDDGGMATTSDFTLFVGDMEVESGVQTAIDPGVYVVDEFGTSTANYEASFAGDCDAEGNIDIAEGEHLECTITNDDIAEDDGGLPAEPAPQCGTAWARIVIEGSEGTGETIFVGSEENAFVSGEWFMVQNNGTAITDSDVSSLEGLDGLLVERQAGTVRVVLDGDSDGDGSAESINGYIEYSNASITAMSEGSAGYELENENDGVTAFPSDEIDDASELADEQGHFWMHVTTSDDAFLASYDAQSSDECATVTVTKVIVNDDGGTATTSDFTLLVGSVEVESGVPALIDPGTYVVDEFGTSTANYEASFAGDCDAEGNLTVTEGGEFECVITNNDLPVEGDQCTLETSSITSDSSTEVNATSSVAVDNDTETEGNQVPSAWTADIDGATWIWSDAQNDGDAAPGTEVFTREFNFSSDATSTATLLIATDNTYEVRLNGVLVGSSTDEVNFTLETQDEIDLSDELVEGSNTLEITVTNLGEEDNPAGLLYRLDLEGFVCEVPPADDDDDSDSSGGGGGGGRLNQVDRDGDDDDDGEVLGEFVDLTDSDQEMCVLTQESEDLSDAIEDFLRDLEDVMDLVGDEDWDDAEDEIEALQDDLDDLRDDLSDADFEDEEQDLEELFDDLREAIEAEDEDEAEDLSLEIADLLQDVDDEVEEDCIDDDDGDDDTPGVVLGDIFSPGTGAGIGFPNAGAGGGVNGIGLTAGVAILTALLGTLLIVRKTFRDMNRKVQ